MTGAPLSMIELRPDAFAAARWMEEHKVVRPGHDEGYGWHALLAACFGDLAPRPFRIIEKKNGPLQLLAYTREPVVALNDHAASFATPSAVAALAPDRMTGKTMPTSFATGQRLDFEVRVRPTVRQDRDGNRNRSREIDAFLAAVQNALPRSERPELDRARVYRDWLTARVAPAAVIETSKLVAVRRTMLLRRGRGDNGERASRPLVSVGSIERGSKGEQGGSPDVVMAGTLQIAEAVAFADLLARGVGRHLSFGFGMLLLRPAGRV